MLTSSLKKKQSFIKITILGDYRNWKYWVTSYSQPNSHSCCTSPLFLGIFLSLEIEKKGESSGSVRFNQTNKPMDNNNSHNHGTHAARLHDVKPGLTAGVPLQFCPLWFSSQLFPSWPLEGASRHAKLCPAFPNLKPSGTFSFIFGTMTKFFHRTTGFLQGIISLFLAYHSLLNFCPLGSSHLPSSSVLILWPSCYRVFAHASVPALGIFYKVHFTTSPAPPSILGLFFSFQLTLFLREALCDIPVPIRVFCNKLSKNGLPFNTNFRYDEFILFII